MTRPGTRLALAAGALVLLLAPLASGQRAGVVVDGEETDVVVDGDYVRVKTPEGVTEVDGDWRRGGTVEVSDTDRVLVELGAVRRKDHIQLALQGDVLFDFGSSAVRPDAAGKLARVAHVIRQRAQGEVLVVGHTDARGAEEANQKLSEARALSVIRWLHAREGIPVTILTGRGMGERQPIAPNTLADGGDDPAGRARNRRVEIFLATKKKADIRRIADRVTIEGDRVVVDGVAEVEGGRVRVGGVTIDPGGGVTTEVSGVVPARSSGGAASTCPAGQRCTADCAEGNCRMSCSAGATCKYSCSGGDCGMDCAAGATCDFSCAGGNCRFTCAVGATCTTSCQGGDCSR